MRNIINIMLVISSFIGCKEENNEPKQKPEIPHELIGTWKAIEVYSTDGGSLPVWSILPEQSTFYYSFFNDYTVKTDFRVEGCNEGEFCVNDDSIITFVFPCITHIEKIDSLTDELLILDTQNFEPFKYKYQKIFE